LNFIANRDDNKNNATNSSDTRERAYKIKNLLKELPTYAILYKRGVNGIESAICPRCKKEEENWKHIWTCENNKMTVREAIENALIEYQKKMEKDANMEKVRAIRKIAKNFMAFLQEESEILIRKTKEWELLRGIYNENLTKITNDKIEKEVIWEMWKESFKEIKKIWIERCEETEELEKERNLTRSDKRKTRDKRKTENTEKTKEKTQIRKKIKLDDKKFKLVTEQRMTEDMSRNNIINRKWHTYIKM